jgi:hypothetical protein
VTPTENALQHALASMYDTLNDEAATRIDERQALNDVIAAARADERAKLAASTMPFILVSDIDEEPYRADERAKLRPWLRHTAECVTRGAGKHEGIWRCTCGLDAALGGE